MSAGLTLYRSLVPAHSAVLDATIETWLSLAAQQHDASAWGAVYAQAMVWWVAAQLEGSPGAGVAGSSGGAVGAVISQTDGDLSRTYASPAASAGSSSLDAWLGLTWYGQRYLALRASRSVTGPGVSSPGYGLLPGDLL